MFRFSYQSWCVRKCVPTRTILIPIQTGAHRLIGDNATTTALAASSAMVDIGLLNRRSQVRILLGALRQGGFWPFRGAQNRPVRLLCVLMRAVFGQTHQTHRGQPTSTTSATAPRRLRRSPLSGATEGPAVYCNSGHRRHTAQRRPTRAGVRASTTTQPGEQGHGCRTPTDQ